MDFRLSSGWKVHTRQRAAPKMLHAARETAKHALGRLRARERTGAGTRLSEITNFLEPFAVRYLNFNFSRSFAIAKFANLNCFFPRFAIR